MWRHCCLDQVAKAFEMKECKGSKITTTKYNWCLTRDVGNLTITGKKRSMIRRGGLMYSQFYGKNKLQFDALNHFPWEDGDDTMAMMALDESYREALRATMGGKAVDMRACRRSYNHCGRRYLLGSRLNEDQSWGVREEHSLSLRLVQAITAELHCRGDPELRRTEMRFQFYVHPTRTVNIFLEAVTLPIGSWYQTTLGLAPEGMLGIDHQKLAILLCILLKSSYGMAALRQRPISWEKKIQREGNEEGEKVGLGLKTTIEKYGFGWLPREMFNWEANSFAARVADQFPFPIKRLERRYERRTGERAVMIGILQEMDQMIGRIKILGEGEEDGKRRSFLVRWLATRLMRQYHHDVWDGLYKSPFEFKGKESEREQQRAQETEEMDSDEERRPTKRPRITIKNAKAVRKRWEQPPGLTYSSVRADLEEEPLPVGIGKLYFNRNDFFQLIFRPEKDGMKGQGWQNKPYLYALERIRHHLREEDYELVMRRLQRLFNTRCHCIPNISRDRWLANSGQSKFKPGWVAFDDNGDRIDCSSFRKYLAKEVGSSWLDERSMHEDKYWNIGVDEAIGGDYLGGDLGNMKG